MPVTPDAGGARTWWEDMDANGDWFRALSDHLVQRHGLDTGRVWLTGYSGGAQFTTKEVLADRQNWIRGGGALLIGNGGARGMQTAPSAAVRSLPIRWTTGSEDVAGATVPATWSALTAARNGREACAAMGFPRTDLRVPDGMDHDDYALDALFASGLTAVPGPGGSFPVAGAIGAAHRAAGGTWVTR